VAPLPLPLHLLAQCFCCLLLVRGTPALCHARLLAHPLTAQRINTFHELLGAMSQPCE